jgi:hypothetical protein
VNPNTPGNPPLTDQQRQQLDVLIQHIKANPTCKISLGRDFNLINLDQLHRETHTSIELFAWDNFGIKASNLSRYRKAAQMRDQLQTELGREFPCQENDQLREALSRQEKPTAMLDLENYPAKNRLMIARVAVRPAGSCELMPRHIKAAAATLMIKSSMPRSPVEDRYSEQLDALKDCMAIAEALAMEGGAALKKYSRRLTNSIRVLASADQHKQLGFLPVRPAALDCASTPPAAKARLAGKLKAVPAPAVALAAPVKIPA